jgi:hypothetical protein
MKTTLEKIIDHWDEALVYVFTVVGVLGYMWWGARQVGEALHLSLDAFAWAGFLAVLLSWFAERRGSKAISPEARRLAKRKNIHLRLATGLSFGFLGQGAFPLIVDSAVKGFASVVTGGLK